MKTYHKSGETWNQRRCRRNSQMRSRKHRVSRWSPLCYTRASWIHSWQKRRIYPQQLLFSSQRLFLSFCCGSPFLFSTSFCFSISLDTIMNCEVAVKMNPAANFSHVLNNVGVFNGSVRTCSVQSSSLLRTV